MMKKEATVIVAASKEIGVDVTAEVFMAKMVFSY